MKDSIQTKITRRRFVGRAVATAAGIVAGASSLYGAPAIIRNYRKPNSLINGVQIGVITYSFRSMEDQSAEATLQYILDTGINAVELMGGPAETFAGMKENPIDRATMWGLMRKRRSGEGLTDEEQKELYAMQAEMQAYGEEVAKWRATVSMDKFEKLGKMFKDAGVMIYGFKPSAFSTRNTDTEIDYGMRAAKAMGASHVTLEHPSNDEHTMKLGKIARKHKIYVAYHGHEQQTPDFWDTALKQSKYNAMNPDIGHYVAAGNEDPLGLIKDKHKHIMSMHLKDRQTPANGKKNLLWGTGDTPLKEALQLMRDEKYKFPATVELEYEIPEGSDAVKEVAKCLEYCASALS